MKMFTLQHLVEIEKKIMRHKIEIKENIKERNNKIIYFYIRLYIYYIHYICMQYVHSFSKTIESFSMIY